MTVMVSLRNGFEIVEDILILIFRFSISKGERILRLASLKMTVSKYGGWGVGRCGHRLLQGVRSAACLHLWGAAEWSESEINIIAGGNVSSFTVARPKLWRKRFSIAEGSITVNCQLSTHLGAADLNHPQRGWGMRECVSYGGLVAGGARGGRGR